MRTNRQSRLTIGLVAAALLLAGCGGGTDSRSFSKASETTPSEGTATEPSLPGCPSGAQVRPDPAEGILPAAVDVNSATLVALAAGDTAPTTWVLDLRTNTWTRQHPTTAPEPIGTQLVYDPAADVVLAWSGLDDRFWAYDLDTDEWTALSEGPHLSLQDAVYEPRTGRVLLRDPASGSLWAHDPGSDTWRRLPGRPGPRDRTTDEQKFYSFMVGDPGGHQLILVETLGQFLPGMGLPAGRTWRFDLTTHRWSRLHAQPPAVNAGYGESGREIVLDEAADKVLLLGDGVLAAFDPATQRWRTIHLDWRLASTAGGFGPLTRLGHTVVYDPVHGRILVLGGINRPGSPRPGDDPWAVACDVWAYETASDTWTELVPQEPQR